MRVLDVCLVGLMLMSSGVYGSASDPPVRVGRLTYAEGAVDLRQKNSATIDRPAPNWPVASGDRIVTGRQSRAEVSLGNATLRLAENSDSTLLALDLNRAEIRVIAGSVSVSVHDLPGSASVQLRTLHCEIRLVKAGSYRIDVLDSSAMRLTVQVGEASVATGMATFQQLAGEQSHVGGDRRVAIEPLRTPDAFAIWDSERERRSVGDQSRRYVAAGVVGADELDSYGTWHWEPDYGMVWQPSRISRDWAPYRFGQWIWKAPWGWTWVDATPWGFAPSHYGRWAYIKTHWCWIPGPRQSPPVYAPALVGWTSIDHGMIGWYPLGPREEYVPLYRASERHVRALNLLSTPDNSGLRGGNTPLEPAHPPRDRTWAGSAAFAKAPPAPTSQLR